MSNFLVYTGNLSLFRTVSTACSVALNLFQVSYFGLSWMMESYFVATTLFSSILSLSQSGQLAEIFVSKAYEKSGEQDHAPNYRLINAILAYIMLFVMLMSFFTVLFAEPIVTLMAPGFTDAQQELTQSILKFISLFLVIVVFNSFMNLILQSEKIFGKAEKASIIGSIVTMLILVLGFDWFGIWALAYGLICGKLIEFIITIYLLFKINYRFGFSFRLSYEDRLFAFHTIANTFTYVSSTQLMSLIVTSSLSLLPSGILAAYKYTDSFIARIVGLIIVPFSNVYFALLNRSGNSRTLEMDKLGKNIIRTSTMISLGIILFWLCFGRPFVSLFEMTNEERYWLYILGSVFFGLLIPQSIAQVQRTYLMGKGHGNTVFRFLAITQILNGLLCYVLLRYNGGFYFLVIWILMNKILFFVTPLLVARFLKEKLLFPMTNLSARFFVTIGIVCSAIVFNYFAYNWVLYSVIFLLGISVILPRTLRGLNLLKEHVA